MQQDASGADQSLKFWPQRLSNQIEWRTLRTPTDGTLYAYIYDMRAFMREER